MKKAAPTQHGISHKRLSLWPFFSHWTRDSFWTLLAQGALITRSTLLTNLAIWTHRALYPDLSRLTRFSDFTSESEHRNEQGNPHQTNDSFFHGFFARLIMMVLSHSTSHSARRGRPFLWI